MNFWEETLKNVGESTIAILDSRIPISAYKKINLGVENTELESYNLSDPDDCQRYIDWCLVGTGGQVAFGGYLEERNLYARNAHFTQKNVAPRNIHLGVDFWAPAGTPVVVPIQGKVHSFKNNNASGNYGPTIILEHEVANRPLFSLYGHLSLSALRKLWVGKSFKTGDVLGTLGSPLVNVNYAPHLHFQLISEIDDYYGDYPGVCAKEDLAYYRNNCPDPNSLLKMK